MTLYASFLSMAPFILLAVTAGAFGPWSADGNKEWSYAFLWDVLLVLTVSCVHSLGLTTSPRTRMDRIPPMITVRTKSTSHRNA
jgi:hypothetical protein